jgi:hypothetical protein
VRSARERRRQMLGWRAQRGSGTFSRESVVFTETTDIGTRADCRRPAPAWAAREVARCQGTGAHQGPGIGGQKGQRKISKGGKQWVCASGVHPHPALQSHSFGQSVFVTQAANGGA